MRKLLQALINHFVAMCTPYIMNALEPVLDRLLEQAEPVITRKIEAIMEKAMADVDVSDTVNDAVGAAIKDAQISYTIEQTIEEADISSKVNDAIDEADIEEQIEGAIEEWAFPKEIDTKLKEAVRAELRKILTEQLLNA